MNPAASKLHRMPEGGFASQQCRIEVGEGAHLEYYPGLNIPFPEADLRQSLRIDLSSTASLAFVETWAMGRIEKGEHLMFRRLSSRTSVNLAGKPLYRDALELGQGSEVAHDWGVLEGARYHASGFWFGESRKAVGELPKGSLDLLQAFGQVEQGQYYFRGLFDDGVEMNKMVDRVIQNIYRAWDLADPPLHSFTC